MLAFIIVWITSYVNNFLLLNEKIKGKWHLYLWNWFWLKKYRRSYPRGRLDLHDCFKTDLANVGFIPFPEEYQYANPKKVKINNLKLYNLINKFFRTKAKICSSLRQTQVKKQQLK